MEQLLHYVWKHRLYPAGTLRTAAGEPLEVIDPGLWNHDAGPDFFNAKVRIGEHLWVGNVEIHQRSSDWYRHNHQDDVAYENVVLHVVAETDMDVRMNEGRLLPQFVMQVPDHVRDNFHHLMEEESYPPCYKVIPEIPIVKVHAWLNALTVERLAQKTERINHWLQRTHGDWERTYYIILARAIGLGVNSDAFEQWAARIELSQIGKHRDHLEQVEAYFLGMGGLLERACTAPENAERATLWQREWKFLCAKFSIAEQPSLPWKYLRMRPQSFPHVRLLQMARLFHEGRTTLSRLLGANGVEAIRNYYHEALPSLQTTTLDILLINVAAPMLFAYGRSHSDEQREDSAFAILENVKAERNHIMRSWQKAGLEVASAADSQALLQLRLRYCDRKDCLRCRFGAEYMRTL